jgi:hypothetical protein
MKEMHKITQQLRQQKPGKTRISIEEELAKAQNVIRDTLSKEEQEALRGIIGDDASNSRQKLKAVKKALESQE